MQKLREWKHRINERNETINCENPHCLGVFCVPYLRSRYKSHAQKRRRYNFCVLSSKSQLLAESIYKQWNYVVLLSDNPPREKS